MEKINDFMWEIGTKEGTGMNVPVRIFANGNIIKTMQKDRTLKQAMNAAALPSIVKHMLVMSDGHEGYGFPVGGFAAFPLDGGIVSPGAIGFDINCLHPDTKIYRDDGTFVRIQDVDGQALRILDMDKKEATSAHPILFMKKPSRGKILRIKTQLGRQILATKDHPVLTQRGMVLAKDLRMSDSIIVYGLEGMEYTYPSNKYIVTEDDLKAIMDRLGIKNNGNARVQIIKFLQGCDLSNIKYSSKKLPILLKLLGMIMGDGTIPSRENGVGPIQIYGKTKDLETIRGDFEKLGVRCAIYHRKRKHSINTAYGVSRFENEEHSLHVSSIAFSVLMAALGCPVGNKSAKEYGIPAWLKDAEPWQKRLFLSAYFGAELSSPRSNNDQNIWSLSFSVSKLEMLQESAVRFLMDIKKMLLSLGIETSDPAIVEGYRYKGVNGKTVGFRMSILSNTDNMLHFFNRVGYVYNTEKERLASLASLYTTYLKELREELTETREKIIEMQYSGISSKEILTMFTMGNVSTSFVEHTIWGRRGNPRVYNSESFSEFCVKREFGHSGFIYDGIASIQEEKYAGDVYDMTMGDHNHNFIANSMVVSNCGVRLIKTNLNAHEIKPKMKVLMDALFNNVPSGVGSKINLGFTRSDLEKVAIEGARYVISKGYGTHDDIESTEENGAMEGADPSKVSDLAKKRGVRQLGTLGAGNHFLEVQKVDRIMDERLAKAYALEPDQVVIMLHSGSRGYGHQVCSDYLRVLSDYQKAHNIQLADPELSYAYLGSKEADDYLKAMKCAVNFAFANRQIMMHLIRKSFSEVFGRSADALGMDLLYDVAHNIAKDEEHDVDGKRMKLLVHRKGATRAFGPGRKELSGIYREYGQPVIIPGSMGTASYVLAGRKESDELSFGSSCHGSGRVMSRHQAIREIPASKTLGEMKSKDIEIRVRDRKLVSEEAEWAYKSVDDVVASVEGAGISAIVARMVPLGVAKG